MNYEIRGAHSTYGGDEKRKEDVNRKDGGYEPWNGWEENINLNLREIYCGYKNWIHRLRIRI
jgi:hypothetical protein